MRPFPPAPSLYAVALNRRTRQVLATGIASAVLAATGVHAQDPPSGCYEIRGVVWEDVNRNGVREPGEPGIAGVQVDQILWSTFPIASCPSTSTGRSTQTNASGEYRLFLGGWPYRIGVAPASGNWQGFRYVMTRSNAGGDDWVDSDAADEGEDYGMTKWSAMPVASVTSGVDFGLVKQETDDPRPTGWVRGRAFLAQADGTRPESGGGLAGVKVDLLGPGWAVVRSTLTDAGGAYAMEAPEGTYRLIFRSPIRRFPTPLQFAGNDPSRDSDIDWQGIVAPFILPAGETLENLDGGYFSTYDVLFEVWQDLDGNGIREATEPPIAGITVEYWGENGTTPLAVRSTDAKGVAVYVHSGPRVSIRCRVLKRSPRDSYSPFAAGGDPSRDSDVYTEGEFAGSTAPLALPPDGWVVRGGQAGIISQPSVQRLITGRVFPADAEGYEQEGSSGIGGAGVELQIFHPSLNQVSTLAYWNSDDTGSFSIPLDFESSVIVRLKAGVWPGDWRASPRRGAPGGPRLANQLTRFGYTEWMTLAEGATWNDVGLGFARRVPVRGRAWHDVNANGVQDDGEPGLSEIVLTARSSDYPDLEQESVTDSAGAYEFTVTGTSKLTIGALRPHPEDQFSPFRVGDPSRDSDVQTEGAGFGWIEEFLVPPDGVLPAAYDVGVIFAPPPRLVPPLMIKAIDLDPNGEFRFLLHGPPGGTYQTETFQSGSVPPWLPIGEPFVTTDLETLIRTPQATGPGVSLFRVRRVR